MERNDGGTCWCSAVDNGWFGGDTDRDGELCLWGPVVRRRNDKAGYLKGRGGKGQICNKEAAMIRHKVLRDPKAGLFDSSIQTLKYPKTNVDRNPGRTRSQRHLWRPNRLKQISRVRARAAWRRLQERQVMLVPYLNPNKPETLASHLKVPSQKLLCVRLLRFNKKKNWGG